jgi:chemotaxis protein CheD
MKTPPDVMDIFLQPGDFYFGDSKTRIRTLLGSCVAISIWHPRLHIGGMCHYMLPRRPRYKTSEHLDGRYAEDAMHLFMFELKRSKTKPSEYKAKLFGGGNMFSRPDKKIAHNYISDQNVDFGRTLMTQYGFSVHAEDMGGDGHRNILFDLWSGDVWVRRPKDTL